jgi:hypothetical protein
MTTPTDGQDLASLIEKAQAEAIRARPQPAVPPRRLPGRAIKIVVLLVALAGALHLLWDDLFAPPVHQTTQDLEAAVDAARESIERARAQTGQLPTALPNAALATVVRYEPDAGGYRLSATIMGVRVTLEPDGRRKTETGVDP